MVVTDFGIAAARVIGTDTVAAPAPGMMPAAVMAAAPSFHAPSNSRKWGCRTGGSFGRQTEQVLQQDEQSGRTRTRSVRPSCSG
jgi:hypothetical protein